MGFHARHIDFRWPTRINEYLVLVVLEGDSLASESGYTHSTLLGAGATKSYEGTLKCITHFTPPVNTFEQELPVSYTSPIGYVDEFQRVDHIVGNGVNIPVFDGGFTASSYSTGFVATEGQDNYISFYRQGGVQYYSINQEPYTAYTIAETFVVQYATWTGYSVIDFSKAETKTFSISLANKWQYLKFYIFDKRYFKYLAPFVENIEGVEFVSTPIVPIKIPSGYPDSGKYGVQYMFDASFSTQTYLLDNPTTSQTVHVENIPYLNTGRKSYAIWPETVRHSVINIRVPAGSKPGGTLYSRGNGLNVWTNITGKPSPLSSLGTPNTDTPFIWPTWVP